MFKKASGSHPPNPGRVDTPFPGRGRSKRRGEEVQTALCAIRSPLRGLLANGGTPPVLAASEKPFLGVEPLSTARTMPGTRRVLARQGWAGEKGEFLNISARRTLMSLSIPDHLPVLTKQSRARIQRRPATQDHSDQLRTRMVRLTVNLPAELADRMRDAVYWTPGLTIAWFVASAIRTSLTELETINRAPFPKRARQLRPGRPRLMGQSLKLRPRFPTSGTCDLADSVSSVTPVSRSTRD
jgi:hypothetical protein